MVIDVAERKVGQDSSRPAQPAPVALFDGPAQRGGAARRVLVVERDEAYAALASALLRRDGWEVELASDGRAALQRLHADGYNVVLVDTGAATLENGESLLAEIRGASDAPVIVLSAQEDREEVVEEALERADYDLVKPFSPRRFRAAVRVVSRRGRAGAGGPALPSEVRVGDVAMSFGRLEVAVGDRRVELSPREFALLHLMLAHPGTVFTREELAQLAWGWRGHTDSRAIDNSVRRLRQKIEPDARQPRYIVTERGAGYRFAVP
jgi:DNA-binding response OmpR family regulator